MIATIAPTRIVSLFLAKNDFSSCLGEKTILLKAPARFIILAITIPNIAKTTGKAIIPFHGGWKIIATTTKMTIEATAL